MSFAHLRSMLLSLVCGFALFGCNTDGAIGAKARVVRLVVLPDSVTIDSTQSVQFQVYGLTAADDTVAVEGAVSWSTSNTAVASISSNGLARAKGEGNVTIMATNNGKSATARVVVTAESQPPPPPPPPPAEHVGWHVAPNGSSSASGSRSQPWSLSYALAGAGGQIEPGDTVWLHDGTYRGKFTASVAGVSGRPVVFRQYPGERAIIDVAFSTSTTTRGDAFIVNGPWTVWWGFEMTNTDPNRYTSTRANMIINNASNTKFINLVVHDGGVAFYSYANRSNVEVNGTIFYNNGWQGSSQSGGHALYLKADAGPLVAKDNIMFNQFGYGTQVYSEPGDGGLMNITLEGNVSFNNGSLGAQYANSGNANLLVGGWQPAERSRVVDNMTYFSPGIGLNNMVMGFQDYANADLVLRDNYAVGGVNVLTVGQWQQLTASGNRMFGSNRLMVLKDNTLNGYSWSGNSYWGNPAATAWQYAGRDYDFASWKLTTGLGVSDIVSTNAPLQPEIFVRPNDYERGRATVVVYNWGERSSVSVDLGGVLTAGARYEVRNVQNLFGGPVTSGTFSGTTITIPMGGVAPPTPVGSVPHIPPRTGPFFDVFIVREVED